MFYPRLPGEGLSILSEVHPARLLLLLVPQLRVPDRSGHRRTSTTSSRCQSALSGLNASSGSLPHCRTPTARARSLTVGTRDLNCECEMSDRMSEEMSDRMPDRMSDRMLESPPMVIRLVALAIKIVHAAIPTVTAGQLWLSRSSWDVVERWACGTSLDRSDAFRTYLHRSPGQREANHFLCCVGSL